MRMYVLLLLSGSRAPVQSMKSSTAMRQKAERKGTPDLNILSIYNMPFRGIAKLMGPMVSLEMADCILEIVNGHFWRGLGHLLGAWRRKGKTAKAMASALASAGKED